VGVPADVIQRRPDVRKAERDLASQTAKVGVATADMFPRVTFNGSVAFEASHLSSIGSAGTVEPHTSIGSGCSLHCRVHLTDYSQVADYVFIGPGFISMSDLNLDYRRPHLHQPYRGVTLGRGARVGGGVVALPGCTVGEETVVGAGSQIRGTLESRMVYLGSPARAVRRVSPRDEIPPSA